MLARFDISDPVLALATHTAGWPVKHHVTYHEGPGTKVASWFVDQDAAGASAVHAALGEVPAKNLQKTDPEHRILAARHGIEAVMTLELWIAGRISPPAVVRTSGKLLRCIPSTPEGFDLLPVVWPTLKPAVRVHDVAYAAGLIVCGFPVYPQLVPPANGLGVGFVFPAESITFKGLTEEAIRPAAPGAIRTEFPAGYSPGEHPFEYAFTGAGNYLNRHVLIKPAEENPTIFIKGDGTSGVLASQSLLADTHPDSAFRDRVHNFLA